MAVTGEGGRGQRGGLGRQDEAGAGGAQGPSAGLYTWGHAAEEGKQSAISQSQKPCVRKSSEVEHQLFLLIPAGRA